MEIILIGTAFLGLLAWGDLLVRRALPRFSEHALERALAGFGLLWGAGALAIHLIGLAELLYQPLAWAIEALCVMGIVVWLAGLRHRADWRWRDLIPAHFFDRLLLAGIIAFAIVNLLGCLTPEIRDDCLINHQAIPAGYANAHRIDIHPFNMNMGRPQILEMWYILPLLFQNVFGPKLIHSMFMLVGLAAMGWLLVRTCERRALWLALFFFYSLPVVTLYATTAYVDLARIYYEVFPLWLILRYQQDRRRLDLILAAVIAGFGMGVHWLSAFFGWPILVATVFCAVVLGGGERRWRRAFADAAIFGAIALFFFLPWILRNWIFMGNPTQVLFRTPGGLDQPQQVNPSILEFFATLGELPQRLGRAVHVISVSGNAPPILLLMAIIFKFATRDHDPRRSAMIIFAVLHIMIFAITLPLQDGRYILPGMAVATIVFFHYAERLLANYGQYRRYLVGGILALGLLNFGMGKFRLATDYREAVWPVYTREEYDGFLENHYGDLSMHRYINAQLPPDSRVLLEHNTSPLYLWRPFMARNNMDPSILNTLLRRTSNNAELLERLRDYRLTHILIAQDFNREDYAPLTPEQLARLDAFVKEHLSLINQAAGQKLYKII